MKRRGTDLTLIGLSRMTQIALQAAEELARQGVDAEVVDLRSLVPLDRETVLDLGCGSGTTCRAAELEGRNSIGYEINPDFEPMIREKLAPDQLVLGEAPSLSFEHR